MTDQELDATARPAGRAVFARHAASLLLVRDAAGRPSVLMGIRGAGHRFLPNRLVFPGGAVDPADRTAPAAAEPSPALLAALGRSARGRLRRAIAMAAARELAEETGLGLNSEPGLPPRLDGLHYLCRALTPTASPIRFNARFLVADAAAASGQLADSRELHGLRFIPLEEALGLDLMLVTRWVLGELQAWLGLTEEQRAGRVRTRVLRDRKPGWE